MMNKEEINEKLKENGAWCTEYHTGEKDRYVKISKAMELLGQLDEPQKPVVPVVNAESAMKKYLIYTTNSTEPFVVETEEDLITTFTRTIEIGEVTMFIEHKKDLTGMGTYKYQVMLNVNNIVSITTSEKV